MQTRSMLQRERESRDNADKINATERERVRV